MDFDEDFTGTTGQLSKTRVAGDTTAYPRINGELMISYVGKPASILGELMDVDKTGKLLKLMTTDDHVILCQLSQPLDGLIDAGSYLEIEGTIDTKNKIKATSATSLVILSPEMCVDFDKALWNEMITQTIIYREEYMRADDNVSLFYHFGTTNPGPNGQNIDILNISEGLDGVESTLVLSNMNSDEPSFFDNGNNNDLMGPDDF